MVNEDEKVSLMDEKIHNGYGSTYKDPYYPDPVTVKDDDYSYYVGHGNESPGDSASSVVTKTTLARFWILFVFSILSWLHCVLWNTWGPISESVYAAFGWGPSTVAMTVNWATIMFMVFVVPMCLAIQRCGLRNVMILSSAILFLATGIRCITTTLPWFTGLCELCTVLIGIASTVILAGPSLIASEWFPVNERTTAVACMMGASQLGGIGSYLEPLLVRQPSGLNVTPEEKEDIKDDIRTLLYIGAGASGVLLVTVLVYFPSKPQIPPSVSSSADRLDMFSGVVSLVKNKDFLLLLFAYGVSLGPPIAWLTVMDYSLFPLGFHQSTAMWVGVSSVLASSLFPVVYGCFMDNFRGHMRSSLVALMLMSSLCFFWFLLLSYGTIPASTWQVYLSVVGGLTFNYTTIPLFFELAVEMAYPVPEILVSGILTAADNFTSTLFLLVFLIPDVGHLWVTSTLVICSSFTILPLMAAKIDLTRTKCDESDT